MDRAPPPAAPSAPPPGPDRRRAPWLSSIALVLMPAAILVALLWGVVVWLNGTTAGLRTLLVAATWALPSLQAAGAEGSLKDGFTLERLDIDEPGWSLAATNVRVKAEQISLNRRSLDLAHVSGRTLTVAWTPGADTVRSGPPASLALPIELRIRDASFGELRVGPRGADPHVLRDIRLSGRADHAQIRIDSASARYGVTEATASGNLGVARPFPLSAHVELRSVVLDRPLQSVADAAGSLLDTKITATSDNGAAQLKAQARMTPFEPVPLAALSVEFRNFEPNQWIATLPAMRLSGSADLQPQTGASEFTLVGPFKLTNGDSGPLDRKRLPVKSARGTLRWSPRALELAVTRVEGAGGTARGDAVIASDGSVNASATFNGVDAAGVHTAAAPTQASGQLDYRLEKGEQRFSGRASNARGLPLEVDFVIALAKQVLDIQKATARIGDGRADVRGQVRLGKQVEAQLRGEFSSLDLSRFVAGVDTRLNGRLAVDGTLQPVRRGRAELVLTDSRLFGRPVEGSVDLRLDGDLFDVDTALRSGTARLTAKGGLGAGRDLSFDLAAPKLAELAPGFAGSVAASGTVSGTLQAPALVATASASALVLPNRQRVDRLDASVRAGAVPDAPLNIDLTLAGHHMPDRPELSLASATLTATGTTASHSIKLSGMTGAQQPLALLAQGGWRDDAWRGSLVSASTGKPLDLVLDAATPVLISRERIEFGPTAFVARDTRFSEVEFTRTDGRWRMVGVFSNLQPQALDPRARAPRRAVRTTAATPQPLTLAGRWSLELADALNGILVIERTAGDLYGGVDAVHPIGISDVGAALNIVDNRINGTAYLRGRELGKVDAVIDAYVDPETMRLAQQRRFNIRIDATLPNLGWTGPLISDAVQIQGAASVQAVVGGTPADPTADGTVRGRDLRLVWIEHGLRLENGTLDAALEDGVLVVNDMTFTGETRVRPDERRAIGTLDLDKPGSLRIEGRIALQTLTGSIGVRVDKLPILQRRDRWMVVSGDGGITLTPTRAELYAKPVVDGAYVDFSSLRGPRSLPNDVVVVRTEQKTAKPAAPPLDVMVDVEARLGQRFFIRGAGLEARLAGGVSVTGRPAQLRAVGAVRIVDGVYNGYGQRLQIQRGVVTFSGPLENPALNVLAVRTGLPVEVGVQISGTALAPSIRLHSDTAMPDVEKLNWLVLGRPPGGSDGQDRALMAAAAGALFSGQSDGAAANVFRSLGIDEFGFRSGQSETSILPRETIAGTLRSASSGTAAGDFVALGKRINEDLYLTFEQGLSSAAYFVALNYQLTRRLSVIARAGSTTALDLVYTLSFD